MDSVSRDALEWSLAHIERFGDTDFFPLPFEYGAIRHCWDRIRDELLQTDLEKYRPHSPRRIAVPKGRGDFRIVAQLDPRDALLYTAMVYEACRLVEASRVPQDRLVACSYRICPDATGSLFAAKSGWPEFHEQSKRFAESGDFSHVLIADITDFYNQASQHRIENALELAGVQPVRAKVLEEFLSALTAKHSRGLPVGPTASIVLAEACLNDVDTFLLRRGLNHTRYVDDFRVFCRTRAEAVWTLHDLTDYLYTAHRLALNSSKTQILTNDEFLGRELLDPEEEEERGRLALIQTLIEEVLESIGDYAERAKLGDAEDLIKDEEKNRAIRENIAELFRASISAGKFHLGVARHLLRRAAALRTNVIHDLTIRSLPILVPVLRDVVNYLKYTKSASKKRAAEVVNFLENDEFGQLPFSRMWGIELVNSIDGMIDPVIAMRIAKGSPEIVATRCAALVARQARLVDWVRERKENWSNFGPWDRRALIFASAVLPRDERNSWLTAVDGSGESLDTAVSQYVRATS
jgi:hypothetical protein